MIIKRSNNNYKEAYEREAEEEAVAVNETIKLARRTTKEYLIFKVDFEET